MGQANWAKEHVQRYQQSNGADGHIWDGLDGAARFKGAFPTLLLTTKGRKTKKEHTTPLIYGRDKENYVVIASQGGRPNHPGWYWNLEQNPRVKLQVINDIFYATAETVTGVERGRLWKKMIKIYPPYEDYRIKALKTRDIPLVIFYPNI